MKKIVGYILGIIGLLGVDWFTKYLAQVYLRNRTIPIIGDFLQLRYVVNTGLSFSRFAGNRVVTMLMPVLAMVAATGLYLFLLKHFKKRNEIKMITIMNFVSALLISGFLGNYADRIVHGGVIDFISVKGFAVFNVADIYVTVCQILVAVLAIYQGWKEDKEKKEKRSDTK